ncbi:prominin-like protein isoform X2 [Drosophila busckii]|uniref:prominin-like protein isoform X2 n=1 Tax=Drosophila busckii TaxID=30019 RepID=UPI00083F4F02|nr:prominin-like protein isoform X2 [Drosophila busckii]
MFRTQLQLHIYNMKIKNLYTLLLVHTLVWVIFSRACKAEEFRAWRIGYEGLGTIHEQLGQKHFPKVIYSDYKSNVSYSIRSRTFQYGMTPVHKISHCILDNLFRKDPTIPKGYISTKLNSTLVLGPRYEQNDWKYVLRHYWFLLLWVFLLLLLIIAIPFFGVIYCCFCCCRCNQICAPCIHQMSFKQRLCCNIALIILTVLLFIAWIIALLNVKLIERGLRDSSLTLEYGSLDTCNFLKDVTSHIDHLLITNYEELREHLYEQLMEASKHILLDLVDVSGLNSLEKLLEILENIPRALQLMIQLDVVEKELRFYEAQFRDNIRGFKRDLIFYMGTVCEYPPCWAFLKRENVPMLGTSKCLHLDKVPNTTVYVEAIRKIIKDKLVEIPKAGVVRLSSMKKLIDQAMKPIIPPIEDKLRKGTHSFRYEAEMINNFINAVISQIHFNALRTAKGFDDVNERLGKNRSLVNGITCLLLLLLLILLICALVHGICVRRSSNGYNLLVAVILIALTVLSFLLLVGLFYFVLGLITYQGVCAPLRDGRNSSIFKQLDSEIDLRHYLPDESQIEPKVAQEQDFLVHPEVAMSLRQSKTDADDPQPLRVSKTIEACTADQTIFDLLRESGIYDIKRIRRINVTWDGAEHETGKHIFHQDLSKLDILTDDEVVKLNEIIKGNLSSYNGALYRENICKEISDKNMRTFAYALVNDNINKWKSTYGGHNRTREYYFYVNTWKTHLDGFQLDKLSTTISALIDKTLSLVDKIDKILGFNKQSVGESVRILVNAIERSEEFIKANGKAYINTLGENFTSVIEDEIQLYMDRVILKVNTNVGHCGPISYVYNRGVDYVCHHLVDPNGFWLAVLFAGFLLMPIIYVAHRLRCSYKVLTIYLPTSTYLGCPICTGAPYVVPPVVVCSDGQQENCDCENMEAKKRLKKD